MVRRKNYLTTHTNPSATPQSEPIPDSTQVQNSAGGYSWEVDDFTKLRRFLVLGSEGGSYYASERKLTLQNVASVERCIKRDGQRVVREVVEISTEGRAPKNDPALFALALASVRGDVATRTAAYAALNSVARTGTHLFQFLEFRQSLGGWGSGLKRAVQNWYNGRSIGSVQLQAVKYRQRNGWTHADVLRLAHPKPEDEARNSTFSWIVDRGDVGFVLPEVLKGSIIEGFERIQASTNAGEAAALIRQYNLPRETVPTELLNNREVWEALLEDMPMMALVRNLATITRHGLLSVGTHWERQVLDQLGDVEALQKSRIHPLNILTAQYTYQSGRGLLGQNTWTANKRIVDALDSAFYATFKNVEPSGKRIQLALDVSGSMDFSGDINGIPGFTPRVASGALALVTMNAEKDVVLTAFTSTFRLLDSIHAGMRLPEVIRQISNLSFGGTDCSQPMIWAEAGNREFDFFGVYTDSETWAGYKHPSQALKDYRRSSGINARLAVVGMVANDFTIADPSDSGMLDVVGFDSATPQVLGDFAAGRI